MANSMILDQFGRPIKKDDLSKEIARASLTGVRNIWGHGSEAQWITPDRLAMILRDAANGDADAYLTLAEEAEERDMHYASVLGTRKRAITGLSVFVESASDSAEHVKHAELIRQVVRLPEFLEARDDLLDGIGKGFSVVEMNWDTRKVPWLPRNRYAFIDDEWKDIEGFAWRDPRFFMYDRDTGRQLRMKDDANTFDGLPLPRYRMIVHQPRLKTGLPIRGGLARLVIAGLMCKWYSITDWLAFAEVFGMPLRVGRYGPQATADDIFTLVSAIANLGTDAAAAIPDSMKIDFESPGNTTGGADLFKNLAEWIDKQVSKAVLGQTGSADGTPGQLGNNTAQDEVRQDILKSDARQLDNTLNRDFVRAVIDLNFGVQDEYPAIQHIVTDAEDTEALIKALSIVVPMGVQIEESWARDKIGAPAPQKGARVLVAPGAMVPALNQQSLQVAHNREQQDVIDDLVMTGLADWEEQMDPILQPVRDLLQMSDSAEVFAEGLAALLDAAPNQALLRALTAAMFKAYGAGFAGDV